MGQEASCCGNTQKTTRTGGKITYDGKKKRRTEEKDKKKSGRRNRDDDTDRDTCKFDQLDSASYTPNV